MATTDTRSGFRLPWSSDRTQDTDPSGDGAEMVAEGTERPATDAVAWPASDVSATPRSTNRQSATDLSADPTQPDAQEPEMIDMESAPPPAPVAPRKPTKLMADLSAAIRATAESARDGALTQVEADVAAVVEQIRAGSKEGEDLLRVRSDEDITKIKEWSRAEIARIKEETESRISARKLGLDGELAAHAAAIEQRVGEVETAAAAFRTEIETYTERLSSEDDPARLATMAESMPEPPALDTLADLGDLQLDLSAATVTEADEAEAAVETVDVEPEAAAETVEVEAVPSTAAEPESAEPEAVVATPAQETVEANPVADVVAASDDTDDPASATAVTDLPVPAPSPWREADSAWGGSRKPVAAEPEPLDDDGSGAYTADADVPTWEAVATAEGSATDGATGEPADRGEMMTAAESAAESGDQAEPASGSADQDETAADLDPEAAAALAARIGAGGIEESYTDRLASLLPNHAEGPADGEPRTTQVIVSGLVSVASIASFKRHLGRLAGVQTVAVASGPDGEFVFNVTHRPDVSFRDALPTMPGFAARVTSTDDSSVHVTARDPEAEG